MYAAKWRSPEPFAGLGSMNTKQEQAHAHHYVPRWYQKRFLRPGQTKCHYLDLHPETMVSGPVTYQRRALRRLGPARWFYQDDLYTVKLGDWPADEVEKHFFGLIDAEGRRGVEVFGDYGGYPDAVHETFLALPRYMGAQRF